MLLFCASFGCFASLFLVVGLTIDCRQLLLPWIVSMIADVIVEASHFFYVVAYEEVSLAESRMPRLRKLFSFVLSFTIAG